MFTKKKKKNIPSFYPYPYSYDSKTQNSDFKPVEIKYYTLYWLVKFFFSIAQSIFINLKTGGFLKENNYIYTHISNDYFSFAWN